MPASRDLLAAITVLVVMLFSHAAFAGVGDPTLRTDHPIYPGEGAFQSVEDCVSFATRGVEDNPQARALAVYRWLLQHQFHLASPQEWYVPGVEPDAKKTNYDMIVEDANRGRFSYGYGLCGTVHTWNEPYWAAIDMRARRRAFPGHTNSEIEYGGGWHAFDTDMAGLVFRPDGVVAGYDDIAKKPSIVTDPKGASPHGVPCYPFAWPGDFNVMKKGWEQVSKTGTGKWYKMYASGYAAHPGIVRLRSGETFTRWYDRDHYGGAGKRRFWHHQPGGPYRDWTFVNKDKVTQADPRPNALGRASYCNAEFVYTPDPATARTGEAWTFDHYSPYVIAGDPADDANPMTGHATGGLVVNGQATGKLAVSVSADNGQTWREVTEVSGAFAVDMTDHVKGRYGWVARLTPSSGATLKSVTFTTVCQMNQAMYPRLTSGGCQVTYNAGSLGVVAVEPNWSLADDAINWERREMRSGNVAYTPRGPKQRVAYKTTNNKPGVVVLEVASPDGQPLQRVNAAARFGVRVPPPKGHDFHIEISTDDGKTWTRAAEADVPSDNEYSSGWMYGSADVSAAKSPRALVRIHFYNGGYTASLIDARAYGIYRTKAPSKATVTVGWKEGDAGKTHSVTVPAGAGRKTFTVPTGDAVTDDFVRIAVD